MGIELVSQYPFGMRAAPAGYPDSGLWFTTIDGRVVQFDSNLNIVRQLRHPQPGWLGTVSFHRPTNRIATACKDRVVLLSLDGTTLWEAVHAPYPDNRHLAASCLIDRNGRIWASSPGDRGDSISVLDGETGRPTATMDLGVPGRTTRIRNHPGEADVFIAVYQGQNGRWGISASLVDGQIIADRQDDDVPDDWSPVGDRTVWQSFDNEYLSVARDPAGPAIASRHISDISGQYGFANSLFVGEDLILADDEEKAYLFSSDDLSTIDSSSYEGLDDIESLEAVARVGERRWITYKYDTNTAALWEWNDLPNRL